MKEFAKQFYNSKKWRRCRSSFIAERINEDGGLCEVCGERAGYIVHHKIILDSRNISIPEISLNKNNLMYVCKECHDQFEGHFCKSKGARRFRDRGTTCFDENGDPYPAKTEENQN